MLNPSPVGLASGKSGSFGETVQFIGVVVLLREPILIPHRIGDHPVEGPQAVALAKFGVRKVSPISI